MSAGKDKICQYVMESLTCRLTHFRFSIWFRAPRKTLSFNSDRDYCSFMRKIQCFFVIITIALTAHAEARIAYYKGAGSVKVIGAGYETTTKPSGIMVVDLETLEGTSISAFTLKVGKITSKVFSVYDMDNFEINEVLGKNGSSYAIVSKAEQPSSTLKGFLMEQNVLTGINSYQKISDSYGFELLPLILLGSASNILSMNGYSFFGSGTTKLTLDLSQSRKYNAQGSSVSEIIAILRNQFIGNGYTENVIEKLP